MLGTLRIVVSTCDKSTRSSGELTPGSHGDEMTYLCFRSVVGRRGLEELLDFSQDPTLSRGRAVDRDSVDGPDAFCIPGAVRPEGRGCRGISERECDSDRGWRRASWRNSQSYDSVSV
ncbi:hypothetical protein EYF80_051366 [Liparis tanakae]|uniref:Uncharacterized protein n=1 Tax=Liparis tanakae TaxID=230148 RepID=A0A4Z2FCH9_9TELE|nr:hypothetical protein EYF80_051366 [Liparis tanakae]